MILDYRIVAGLIAALALLLKAGAALVEERHFRERSGPPDARVAIASWVGTFAWGAAGIAMMPVGRIEQGPVALVILWAIAVVVGELVPRVLRGEPPLAPPTGEPSSKTGPGAARAALAASWITRSSDDAGIVGERVIERLIRFRELRADGVMVPLVNLSAIGDDRSVAEAIARIGRDRISRLPVFHERSFDMVGILHAIDLVGVRDRGEKVAAFCRPPTYVPATKPADALLVAMRYEGTHMAIVVDEYGGAIGAVTISDLLGRVVGDITDEHGTSAELVRELGAGRWHLDARLRVLSANERFGWSLPLGPYETIAGLVAHACGRIPVQGEELEIAGLRVRVVVSEPRAVREVEVEHVAALPGPDDLG